MTLTLAAADLQLLIAGMLGLCGLVSLALRRRSRADAAHGSRRVTLLLALLLVASAANYFVLGRNPAQYVKAWDVQHSWLGSKYAAELGYFRIYECTWLFDAQALGHYREVKRISDLRAPLARVPAREAAEASDCMTRFSDARRAEFQRDLNFFESLPQQPHYAAWFVDNGYNQSPFFTTLTSPLFQREPRYGFLLALTFVDVALASLPFLLVARAFGARTALLAALYFFTSFSSQFGAMGGSILRFAYLAFLIAALCLVKLARPRAAGAALGVATLFQIFPVFYAIGLALAAAWRWLRRRELPAWALPFAGAYAVSLAAGFAASLLVVSPEAWREFAAKLALHANALSEYRVGLELALVLDWPPTQGWLPYAKLLSALREKQWLVATCGAALLLAGASLAPRLRPFELAILVGTLALYVVTPVHYYFASLVLLFLIGAETEPTGFAETLARSLLYLLSAGAFAVLLASDSLALANNYWLSLGLGCVLLVWIAALHAERRPLEA